MTELNPSALIYAKQLSVVKAGKKLLDNITLELKQGEILTLIGPNGAGKTTLVQALLGLIAIEDGAVVRQQDLTIAYVPQQLKLDPIMPLTVLGLLRLEANDLPSISSKLQRTGAQRLLHRQVSQLSGGELRRVLIARALLKNAQLLVMDEPTAGLDLSGQAQLYQLLTAIRDETGCGILLVSHDLHLVMAATDKVICLNHHICCEGKPSDINQHPEYLKLFGGVAGSAVSVYSHHHNHEHALDGAVCDH